MSEIPPPKSCSLQELKEYSKLIDKPLYFNTEDGRRYMVRNGVAVLTKTDLWKVGRSVPMPEYDHYILEQLLEPETLKALEIEYPAFTETKKYYDRNGQGYSTYLLNSIQTLMKLTINDYRANYGYRHCYRERHLGDLFEYKIYPEYYEKMCVNFKPAK